MKKYLILPAAALALGLASCTQAEPEPPSSQEFYTREFIRQFGIIDPNHTWGFTFDRPGSRYISTNGNQWKDDWYYPQDVTKQEHDWVMAYVGQDAGNLVTVELSTLKDDFHNFFVTHVGASWKEYTDGGQNIIGGDKMNYLHIAETQAMADAGISGENEWPHVNNFNAAGNSSWSGHMLVLAVEKPEEMTEPEIQAATAAHSAYDFCYHNSYDGNFYGRYKIVPGTAITAAKGQLDCYYYLCFDYMVKQESENAQTGFNVTYQEGSYDEDGNFTPSGDQQTRQDLLIDGVYLNSEKDNWPSDADFLTALGKTADNAKIISTSIYRYNNAKVIEPDNVYDDWVIRLVGNATPRTQAPPEYYSIDAEGGRWKRVFVEDLAARASYDLDINSSDWDFNDVVFDLYVDETSRKATIQLHALGGTLPVYIGTDDSHLTDELHWLMGYTSDQMINTGAGATHTPVMVDCGEMTFDPYDYRTVKVFVRYGGKLIELTAETGGAPAKVCGRTTDQWAPERTHITKHWPNFRAWVANKDYSNWTHSLKNEDTTQSGN